MSGFSAEWLALREPFDAAARSAALVAKLRAHVAAGTPATPLEIVDLGAGAGSNLRYLAPLLGGVQRWRLLDHDAALLDAAIATTRTWADARGASAAKRGSGLTIRAGDFVAEVASEQCDLGSLAAIDVPARGLVTAAALLDLVSHDWLVILAERCRDARAAICFALTYDGRAVCTPADPDDAAVLELFNRHQRGDKGFGPALGPAAASTAANVFKASGYEVAVRASDWVIRPAERAMQHALLDGWFGAAVEMAPERRAALAAWHERRRSLVAAGRSTLTVGHVDLVGSASR